MKVTKSLSTGFRGFGHGVGGASLLIKPRGLEDPRELRMRPDIVLEFEGSLNADELATIIKDGVLQEGLNHVVFYGINEENARSIVDQATDYIAGFSFLNQDGSRTNSLVEVHSPVELRRVERKDERKLIREFGEELRKAAGRISPKVKELVRESP